MGLLDQLTSMAGGLGNLGNLSQLLSNPQLAQLMNNPQVQQLINNPQVAKMLQNLDANAIQRLVAKIQKNGIPKDVNGITKLISEL